MKHNYFKNLFAFFIFLSAFASSAQEYTVASIPYSIYNLDNVSSPLNNHDDIYSQVLNLKGHRNP